MNRHERNGKRFEQLGIRRALLVAALSALIVLLASPALAAHIVQVRVGNHPTFSRVVFQLDQHAGYQIESRGTGEDKVMTVTIDANSRDRSVISKSLGIGSVSVEADESDASKSIALVTLRRDDLLVKEMILSNPPRIVLDFEYTSAASSQPSSQQKEVAAPVERAAIDPEPARVEPKPVAAVTPPVVEPEPAPELEVVEVVEAVETAVEVVVVEPEPEPVVEEAIEVLVGEPEHAPEAVAFDPDDQIEQNMPVEVQHEQIADEVAEAAPAPLASAENFAPPIAQPVVKPMVQPKADSAPARTATPIARSTPSDADSSNLIPIAAAVVGALIVIGVGWEFRRRRAIPNDIDVTALPDSLFEDDAPASQADSKQSDAAEHIGDGIGDRIPGEGFEMTQPDSAATDTANVSADETVVMPIGDAGSDTETGSISFDSADETLMATDAMVAEANTAAYSLSEVSANSAETGSGLFDEDPEGEKAMDMESNDLPAQHGEFVATPAAGVGSSDSDLSSMVQELMTRLGTLETRLEESNEARERLERQVAAQSEELRVQRAAIARTQRALRSLSRTDEDQATEPALKTPSA